MPHLEVLGPRIPHLETARRALSTLLLLTVVVLESSPSRSHPRAYILLLPENPRPTLRGRAPLDSPLRRENYTFTASNDAFMAETDTQPQKDSPSSVHPDSAVHTLRSEPSPPAAEASSTSSVNSASDALVDGGETVVHDSQPGSLSADLSHPPSVDSSVASAASPATASGGVVVLTPPGPSPVPTPPVKKFTATNINKKFLQKASSSSISGHGTAAAPQSKLTGSTAKPAPQASPTPSKLVTTKLTASSTSSSMVGPGWSRPSSASPAATPATVAPVSTPGLGVPSSSAAPQLPHAGKVIQPTPRAARDVLTNGVKPAWGSARTASFRTDTARVQVDFPTAAEAAEAKSHDEKALAAQRQAMQETAATFRGANLDPNAHHWDEMEEDDDDNFLDGPLDFGDGRQYQIQPVEGELAVPQDLAKVSNAQLEQTAPVSKEERFGEDIGRGWPPSRDPLSHGLPDLAHHHPSSEGWDSARSPTEQRVLFNERSNKLEPYSTNGPLLRPPHANVPESRKEGNFHGPPHIQQRSVSTMGPPFSKGSLRSPIIPTQSTIAPIPSSPSIQGSSPTIYPQDGHPHDNYRNFGRDRQPPPHLSPMVIDTELGPPPRRSQTKSPSSATTHASTSQATWLPSAASERSPSDAGLTSAASQLNPTELDALRKVAMTTAAERAKQRRKEEEEEREKQRERARKKAQELEEKMAAMARVKGEEEAAVTEKKQQTDDAKATAFITQAVLEVVPTQPLPPPVTGQSGKPAFPRTPSLRPTMRSLDIPRSGAPRRPPHLSSESGSSPALQAENWRPKPSRVTIPEVNSPQPEHQPELSLPARPPPPNLPAVVPDALTIRPDEELEIFDFADLGKMVGEETSPPSPREEETVEPESSAPSIDRKRARPLASDFFESGPQPAPARSDGVSDWRKPVNSASSNAPPSPSAERFSRHPPSTMSTPQTFTQPPSAGTTIQRSPADTQPSQHRKQALAGLDETMSRIRGALDGMHPTDSATLPTPKDASEPTTSSFLPSLSSAEANPPQATKWIAPSLQRHLSTARPGPREVFDVTMVPTPRSPKPVWNTFTVRLPPKHSIRSRVPLPTRPGTQRPVHVRWDILSWDPPVEGMNRRDLSLNDVLFKRQPMPKSRFKYRVILPPKRMIDLKLIGVAGMPSVSVSKVSGPSHSSSAFPSRPPLGAFGRPRADDAISWRKAPVPPPPVEQPSLDLPVDPVSTTDSMTNDASKSRTAQKAVEDVAFYRDPGKEPDASSSSVSFTVHSELDTQRQLVPISSRQEAMTPVLSATPPPVSRVVNMRGSNVIISTTVSSSTSPGRRSSTQLDSAPIMSDGKASDDSNDRIPITPPLQSSSLAWTKSPMTFSMKDSPSRGLPDPEHLKIVWSQASGKAELPPVNSLRGIADDLTAVPFTLQEVKSEDGGTPPPPSTGPVAPPSRLSVHEVTRAFQQVPPSPASTAPTPALRSIPAIGPPAMKATSPHSYIQQLPRSPVYSMHPHVAPPPNSNMRPNYPVFHPSPLVSSPAPGPYQNMLPSPVLGGPVPMPPHPQTPFGQPVWIPVSAPTPQPNGGVVRGPPPPQGSPYGAPVFHGLPAPAVYPSHATPSPGALSPGRAAPRGRGGPVSSPLMGRPSPIQAPSFYAGNPVLVPGPPPPGGGMPIHHHNPYAVPIGTGRGMVNGQPLSSPAGQAPHGMGYASVPPTTFVRPTW